MFINASNEFVVCYLIFSIEKPPPLYICVFRVIPSYITSVTLHPLSFTMLSYVAFNKLCTKCHDMNERRHGMNKRCNQKLLGTINTICVQQRLIQIIQRSLISLVVNNLWIIKENSKPCIHVYLLLIASCNTSILKLNGSLIAFSSLMAIQCCGVILLCSPLRTKLAY